MSPRLVAQPLGDLVRDGRISYGIVQPGCDTPGGVPIVRVKDLKNGEIDTTSPLRVALSIAANYSRTTLRGGELLLSLVGTVGEAAVVPARLAGWNVARAIAVIQPTKVEASWLRICFELPLVRQRLSAVLNTTVQATLNLSELRQLPISVPRIETRSGILAVIGALDAKITSNANVSYLADELARSLYEEAGELSRETTTISALAWSPRDHVDPASVEKKTPYVGLEHLPRRRMWLSEVSESSSVSSTKSRFEVGDVLFGKLRPYFHKVVAAPVSGLCSTDILVCRSRSTDLSGFVLAAISSDHVVERCTAASEGTRMPRSSWNDLQAVEVPWPGEAKANAVSDQIRSIRNAAEAALAERSTLAALRTALLPQLMSGKLRVKDAEKQVEEVL